MKLIATVIAGFVALGGGAILAASGPDRAEAQDCSVTVTDVDFGEPDLLSGDPVDAMASVHARCNNVPLQRLVKMCLRLQSGSGGAGGGLRYMIGPNGRTLAYQLYQDSSRTVPWGPSDSGEGSVPGILLGTGVLVSPEAYVTIYARVFPNQAQTPAGLYSSEFSGAEVAFGWRSILVLGADTDCSGFIPTRTIHPAFEVRALLRPSCEITATDLAFGRIGLLYDPVFAQSKLTVNCSAGAAFAVSLDDGQSGAGPGERRMTSAGGDAVAYNLYHDEARTRPWGSAPSTDHEGIGAGSAQTLLVYGLVPAQSTPPPGAYRDRVTAILTY